VHDHWAPLEGLSLQAGVRTEWNEVVRDLEVRRAGRGVGAKEVARRQNLGGMGRLLRRHQPGYTGSRPGMTSYSTFYLPDGTVQGPVPTSFLVNNRTLSTPKYQTANVTVERKLPFDFYGRRAIRGAVRERLRVRDALAAKRTDVLSGRGVPVAQFAARTLRRGGFRGEAHVCGKIRVVSGVHAVEHAQQRGGGLQPGKPRIRAADAGPFAWDTPNRVHMWGWVPMPKRALPGRLEFLLRNTTAAYLVEYRTGFPFSVVDEEGFLVGAPNGGATRITSTSTCTWNGNSARCTICGVAIRVQQPDGQPERQRGKQHSGLSAVSDLRSRQARAFSVRLRLLGRK